ncbi:efflux RND transporter periplasmic adaptor subunit [Chitinophaga oryziterrae]|uniref:Efflux RND transporter periplasmic adaptor subunit n=1 Tax=Chitinophaga oryziterrae TaxID=1031224 RepID=A0A6N8JIQ8_9BACT|nr:efflux RND transporter periplasmic adaptor subunit [Chitinophaga oryziterrae]MVT44854.1 efflux RND transporter periplasmic adaptor subunit [Chitinophaga oryziterrae]
MKAYLINITLFGLIVLIKTSCNTDNATAYQTPAINVKIASVEIGYQQVQFHYSGSIEARHLSTAAFIVPGRIKAVCVQIGDFVKQGDVVALLETTHYKTALAIATTELGQALDNYTRSAELYNKGSLPSVDYVRVSNQLDIALAKQKNASADMAETILPAPMKGVITGCSIEKGNVVTNGTNAISIASIDEVFATFTVPEQEISQLKKHQKAMITVPALSAEYEGEIEIINPVADPVSKSYTVKVLLHNYTHQLLPGMLGTISMSVSSKTPVMTLPADAILKDTTGRTYVYVADEQWTVTRKWVETGSFCGKNIIITAGLFANDLVIASGQQTLKDGDPIRF